MNEKDLIIGRIYQKDLSQGLTTDAGYAKIVDFGESSGYKWVEAKLGTETNNLHDQKVKKIQRDIFIKLYKLYEFTPNTSQQDGAGKRRKKKTRQGGKRRRITRRKKKTRKKRKRKGRKSKRRR